MTSNKRGKPAQNLISEKIFEATNLHERIEIVVTDVAQKVDFKPKKLLSKSGWWGSKQIGAFHYLGEIEGKEVVLKVQGVKPDTSEVYMIKSFADQNESAIIRPPKLHATLPWDENNGYEALIMEDVGNNKVINVPTTKEEVDSYYHLFGEYRKNCRNNPWLKRPEGGISDYTRTNFEKWKRASFEIYPKHPFRLPEDEKLIDKAVELLEKGYKKVDWDFQHAHLSDTDFYKVKDQIVVLSNLYWSWRAPMYDAIFAYHWFVYHLAESNISIKEVEKQKSLWLEKILKLPQTSGKGNQRLLKLAMLERAAAGLNLDALSIEIDKTHAKYLVESTRKQVAKLVEEINK